VLSTHTKVSEKKIPIGEYASQNTTRLHSKMLPKKVNTKEKAKEMIIPNLGERQGQRTLCLSRIQGRLKGAEWTIGTD
jgi:hypothetical protein